MGWLSRLQVIKWFNYQGKEHWDQECNHHLQWTENGTKPRKVGYKEGTR